DFSKTENAHELALKWMKQEFVKPFQLYDGLLFQFALCKASANCYYWLKKYHHLIVDGWGISLIVQRVAAEYNVLATGQAGGQYHSYQDFIQNDQAYLESEKFVKAKNYWQEKYSEVPEPLMVRRYAIHKPGKTIPSQRSTLRLKRTFYNQLIDFASKNKVSMFHVILGALYCYFVRTCNREDLVIGLPTLNRNNAAFKQTVGLFVGVIPAKFHFGLDLNFIELIQAIRVELQKNYRYQRFPISELNRQLGLQPSNRKQLFDLTLSYMDHNYDANFDGSIVELTFLPHNFEQNALAIFVDEFHKQGDIKVDFDYNFGFFDADEIERLKARFEFLLSEILRQPLVPIRELQIMPDTELNKILVEFNDTATDYPRDKTIVELFEDQVAKTPDAIAVIFENQQLTYRELNTKANQLAHYLQTLGVKPEVLVGICVERSCEMVIGLLGILKAGGAYLPLDPAYPKARLAFMLLDSQVPVCLIQESLIDTLPKTRAQLVCLDVEAKALSQYRSENFASDAKPFNLVYVIYTSGSTGNPKGVLISHQGLYNLAQAQVQLFEVQSNSRILQFTSLSFDVAISDIAMALCSGATLELVTQDSMMSSSELIHILCNHSITHFEIPASILRMLPVEKLPSLQTLIVGGETCSPSVVTQWSKGRRFFNAYGPTEGTVCATVFENTTGISTLPIGRPIANTQIYILDQYLQPVPIGVPGELHLGGTGLARGYLNRPELTAEKFIKNPFSDVPNSRLYKTGDLACYLPDGNIEYLGRIDNQVKIRGFRIELGEIEAALAQHPFVTESAVIVHEASKTDKRLVAYLVPHQGQVIENTALRDFLKERLPDYMIPSAFVTLENLPLTPNGKIDRRALSQLSVSHSQLSEKTFVAPRTADEELLAGIWASVLGIERVGVHDNFFELGGHSLLALNLMARIEQQFGKKLPLSTIVDSPTI
ncbi:MAG: non-ribosomal peptide synthetase, partial [Candidatus Parabeggiatoa sp. nov. 3]